MAGIEYETLPYRLTSREEWRRVRAMVHGVWRADSLRGRFARGAVWSLAGAVISQGAGLAASVITARMLGRVEFGKYGIVQSTIGMLGIFAGAGLGVTATRYVAEYRTRDSHRAGRIVALSCMVSAISGAVLALGLLLFSRFLAAKTLNAPDLAGELRISALLLFFNAFNGAQVGALAGFEAFRPIARINLVKGLTAFPITVALVFFWRLPGSIWALAVTAGVACVLSQFAIWRECRALRIHPEFRTGWQERRILWTFSTPAFLCGALAGPAIWAANTMLVNQAGGYAEMGLFSAASQWRNAIGFVPAVLTQFALPLLSNLNGERDTLRYGKALRWNLILTAGIATAVALPVMVGAREIMHLYGGGFQQGWLVLIVSAATAVISCVNGVVGTAILSAGSIWAGFAFNALWAAALLAGCYYLIPAHLALGLAEAMLIAYLAHTLWQGVYLRYRLSVG
jgi:O-antigen/teichoic acid export membrane protein